MEDPEEAAVRPRRSTENGQRALRRVTRHAGTVLLLLAAAAGAERMWGDSSSVRQDVHLGINAEMQAARRQSSLRRLSAQARSDAALAAADALQSKAPRLAVVDAKPLELRFIDEPLARQPMLAEGSEKGGADTPDAAEKRAEAVASNAIGVEREVKDIIHENENKVRCYLRVAFLARRVAVYASWHSCEGASWCRVH